MRRTALFFVTALLALAGLQSPAQAVGITYPTPTLVADLNPHTNYDQIDGATEFNGALYYSGNSAEIGYELRRINSAGVSEVVADINTEGSSYPYSMNVFKNKLYFVATDAEGDRYLYSLTTSGALVQHLKVAGPNNYSGGEQTAVFNNLLYFYRFDGSSDSAGWELWQTAGSSFALTSIPTHDPSEYMGTFSFEIVNNKLYFAMPTSNNGNATILGVIGSNGIATVAPSTQSLTNPFNLIALGNKLAVVADGTSGAEVYIYDGVNTPVAMNVASDENGVQGSYPNDLDVFNGNLYFSARLANEGGYELWRTNGVSQPTRFTGSYFDIGDFVSPTLYGVLGGRFYFAAKTNNDLQYDYNTGLFSTDGTTIRAEAAAPLVLNPDNSSQSVFNGKMYVTANIGTGFRLYSFDGLVMTEVEHGDHSTGQGYFEPWGDKSFAVTSEALYFSGYTGESSGFFKFDGVSTPTLVPGSQDMFIESIFSIGETVYVSAQPFTYSNQNLFLYKISDTGALVKQNALSDALGINPIEFVEPMGDGTLFVTYQTVVLLVNSQIQVMDTSNLSEIQTGVLSNGNYYFFANGDQGKDIYRWDGINSPVKFVDPELSIWDSAPQLFAVNGEVHFINNYGDGTAMYRVTAEGPVFLGYGDSLDGVYLNETVKVGNSTYLLAYNYGLGERQVWKASAGGLELVADIDAQFENIEAIALVDGRLVVSGFGNSGSLIAAVVESNGMISTILNTGVLEYEEIYGRVASFKGDYYFPYNHPEFGLELATTGSGVTAVASDAPTNLVVGSGTDSSVALSWSAPSNTGGQPLSTYVVEYSTNGSTWTNFYHPASTQTSIVVTSLKFKTNYQFRVKARTLEGNSAATSSVSKKTTVFMPGKVRSLAVASKGITKASAKVTWLTPSVKGSGGIKDYKIETSTNGKKWTVVKDGVSKVASITLKKLKSKTKYFVRVTAIAFSGNGPVSSKVQFKTK